MTIDEIIKYAFSSPENTNPNVLRSMLSQISTSAAEPSGSGDTVQTMKVEINNGTLNKTWQEMYDAYLAGAIIYAESAGDKGYFTNFFMGDDPEEYGLALVVSTSQIFWYIANTASDYPIEEIIEDSQEPVL